MNFSYVFFYKVKLHIERCHSELLRKKYQVCYKYYVSIMIMQTERHENEMDQQNKLMDLVLNFMEQCTRESDELFKPFRINYHIHGKYTKKVLLYLG